MPYLKRYGADTYPDIVGHMDSLTKSLISIKERRALKAERERAEKRQAELDRQRVEQQAFENQQAIQEAERRKEAAQQRAEEHKIKLGLAAEQKAERDFERGEAEFQRDWEQKEHDRVLKSEEQEAKFRQSMIDLGYSGKEADKKLDKLVPPPPPGVMIGGVLQKFRSPEQELAEVRGEPSFVLEVEKFNRSRREARDRAVFQDQLIRGRQSDALKGEWLFNTEERKQEWVPNSVKANAPKGLYRKTYSADVKEGSGSKRAQTVMALFGGPDDPDPTTFWNASIHMNEGNTGNIPFAAQLRGAKQTMYDVPGGQDPITETYLDQRAGFASMIAKEFGEAGRLSDQDIQRTVKLFPNPGETMETTTLKLDNIWRIIKYARGEAERPADLLGEGKKWNELASDSIDVGGVIEIKGDDDWEILNKGQHFIGPDGVERVK